MGRFMLVTSKVIGGEGHGEMLICHVRRHLPRQANARIRSCHCQPAAALIIVVKTSSDDVFSPDHGPIDIQKRRAVSTLPGQMKHWPSQAKQSQAKPSLILKVPYPYTPSARAKLARYLILTPFQLEPSSPGTSYSYLGRKLGGLYQRQVFLTPPPRCPPSDHTRTPETNNDFYKSARVVIPNFHTIASTLTSIQCEYRAQESNVMTHISTQCLFSLYKEFMPHKKGKKMLMNHAQGKM